MMEAVSQCCDCAVIGGGPGGMATALYLARFNRQVLVFSHGKSRAEWSPLNRNYPGFPDGLPGAELVQRFREQAEEFHARVIPRRVERLERTGEFFRLHAGDLIVEARRVVLATGIRDLWPELPGWERLAGSRIRVCPICDAYEGRGKRVGLIGCSDKVAREALYLREFTCEIVLFAHGRQEESPICDALLGRLDEAEISRRWSPIRKLLPEGENGVRVCLEDGAEESIDLLFSALGVEIHNGLATALGAETDEEGYVLTNRWQETTVPGFYAVGDVASAINQVTVAVGQAAIAATSVHNSLQDF